VGLTPAASETLSGFRAQGLRLRSMVGMQVVERWRSFVDMDDVVIATLAATVTERKSWSTV